MKEQYKPVVNGRASICHWNLSLRFYTVEQRNKFVKLLMTDIYEHIEYKVWSVAASPNEYWIEISDYPWANNLTAVSKLLEKCDYQLD